MSCSFAKGAWEARWRDSTGRQRSKRFKDGAAAQAFDAAIRDQATYERQRTRYGQAGRRLPVQDEPRGSLAVCGASLRRDDDKQAWLLKRDAARDARRRMVEQVARKEVVHTRQTFGEHWTQWLERRKPYLEAGTWGAYERDGRLRLLPALADVPLGRLESSGCGS